MLNLVLKGGSEGGGNQKCFKYRGDEVIEWEREIGRRGEERGREG